MHIDSIQNGVVIDHIQAGKGMELYRLLGLEQLDCPVAIIKNVPSKKMGKKDIIKVDGAFKLDLDILGYINPDVTINIIKDNERVDKFRPDLPEHLTNIIRCQNPRCITSIEQEISHIFKLTNKEDRVYRCIYCESKAKNN